MSNPTLSPAATRQLWRFRRSLPDRIRLSEIARALGPLDPDDAALDIASTDGAFCLHLRRSGGKWDTVAPDEETAQRIREAVPDNVFVFEGHSLPFKKKSFAAVVVGHALQRLPQDEAFIEECHKLLKPDGRLVVCVARLKPWSPIYLLRRLLGQTHEKQGFVRPGYTESQLFNVLKDGFDVHSVRTFSRFFLELAVCAVEFARRRLAARGLQDERQWAWFYTVSNAVCWLADQLDLLLFFTRGHTLTALAKRRAWRPRKAPVLVDGRSITEAVLSKALD